MEEALFTPEAKRIVLRIDRFVRAGKKGLRFPVIACRPISGVGELTVTLSIHWDYPLHRKPEPVEISIAGRKVVIPVVERIERLAEKVRAFIDRGLVRDAFDLRHQHEKGLSRNDVVNLAELVLVELGEDDEMRTDANPLEQFDERVQGVEAQWDAATDLILLTATPTWEAVARSLAVHRPFIPETKPERA